MRTRSTAELKKAELTRADLTALARRVLLSQQVQEAVVEDEVGDDELRQQYEQDILQYTTVDAQHILVDTKAEAQDVYDQVTAKDATQKTFENLAKKVSTDGSAAEGGALGSQPAAGYVPEFAAAVAELEPEDISEPVKTEFGWHVIRLIDKEVDPVRAGEGSAGAGPGSHVLPRMGSHADRGRRSRGQSQVRPLRHRAAHDRADQQHGPERYRGTVGFERHRRGNARAVTDGPSRSDELLAHVPEGPVPSSDGGARLLDLIKVMARLRGPGGCPWDAEQTHRTLARHLLEEAHELLQAIDAADDDAIRDELGDLLLQVVFHAQMAADEGRWDVDDVAEGLTKKLIYRHPHVFGEVDVVGRRRGARQLGEAQSRREG